MTIDETCAAIRPPDAAATAAATARQAQLTKPAGALGRLETLSIQLAGVQATARPRIHRPVVVVAAADHGVAAAGVSAYPQAVTAQMVLNFLAGGAAINVLAQAAGAEVVVVDAGVVTDLPPHAALRVLKVAPGTTNLLLGTAMTAAQATAIVGRGIALAHELADAGCDLVALGEMGIGNTTPAALITAAVTGADAATVTGRGTGVDDAQLAHKRAVVAQALALHAPAGDGLAILAQVGGYEIGLLMGLCLGAAARQVAVLVDGYITTAAALLAARQCPAVAPYLIAAHRSTEPGHRIALEQLGLQPLLDLDMRLGEGSGAALAIPLVRAAALILSDMATFADAGVSGRDEEANEGI